MKQVFVVFGILLAMQIASVSASATTKVLDCDFYSQYDKNTGELIGNDLKSTVAKRCQVTKEQVKSASFSTFSPNTLIIMIEEPAKIIGGERVVTRELTVLFPNLASAQRLKTQIDAGTILTIAFRPNYEFSNESGYDAYKASDVIITFRNPNAKPTGWRAFTALFHGNPLFAFPEN